MYKLITIKNIVVCIRIAYYFCINKTCKRKFLLYGKIKRTKKRINKV